MSFGRPFFGRPFFGRPSGDVDPGALLTLARAEGYDLDALDAQLNRHSGLAGLSGLGKDMREIESAAAEGHERARLALQVFCHRVLQYIGASVAAMRCKELRKSWRGFL